MRHLLATFFLVLPMLVFSQDNSEEKKYDIIITPEIMTGVTADANEDFPSHTLPVMIGVTLGWDHKKDPQEWAQRLKGPRTGINLGYSNYGNKDSLGGAYTLMPMIEFNAFRIERLRVQVGMGGSYFTKKYDKETNPRNQAITNDLVWSFRTFLHYQLLTGKRIDWRLGMGYFHHSNGHTRLPNQGLNSFLFSISADIKNTKKQIQESRPDLNSYARSSRKYISLRGGYGVNVLSLAYNDKKPVYTLSGEYGKVWNKTWRVGLGFYLRKYQHYFDYIENEEFLVRQGEEFDYFRGSPLRYGSNFGLHLTGEALLNHIGIHVQLGFNLHKPGYMIDWRINEGYDNVPREIPDWYVLGEFNSKYKMKKLLAPRMGLKYYIFDTSREPVHNVYLGFHINANGGQADFTDLSLGYVYNFDYRKQ